MASSSKTGKPTQHLELPPLRSDNTSSAIWKNVGPMTSAPSTSKQLNVPVPTHSSRTKPSFKDVRHALNNNETPRQRECHKPQHKNQQCFCVKEFYEDDELVRKNRKERLEFGIVSRYENEGRDDLKVFWTLDKEIEEQALDLDNPQFYEHLRLVDRKVKPGDIIFVEHKRGEVIDISWSCYLRILETGMCLLDIPCKRLEPVLPHYPGQRIEVDGWIGTVTNISSEATLMFPKGNTATGVVDCGALPPDRQPYPGGRLSYTYDEYMNAGLTLLDGKSVEELFRGEVSLVGFVLFLHVSRIEVKWNGKVAHSNDSTAMPSTTLSRNQFKKRGRILGSPTDMDWDNDSSAVDRFYQCSVQPDDLIIPEGREEVVEEYMVKKYFDYEAEIDYPSKTMVRMLDRGYNVMTNVPYAVRVLRFSRVLRVKWSSGRVDEIPANRATLKHTFSRPFHQFIQKKALLAEYTDDEYGIIDSFDTNDTVSVNWLTKQNDSEQTALEPPPLFQLKYQCNESIYDLEPHFAYGSISPKHLVYRSVNCRLPEVVFSLGWVRSVSPRGQVVVVSMHTRQEHEVYPSEIMTTGMKIYDDEEGSLDGRTTLDLHGLPMLKASSMLFVKNLQRQLNRAGAFVPETKHFDILPKAPATHAFRNNKFEKKPITRWTRSVKKDQIYLRTKADEEFETIWVKGYADRFDLYSVLMAAPADTPYDGGLYEFDIQLGGDYPSSPPSIYMVTVLHTGSCTGVDSRAILQPGIHNLELLQNRNVAPPYTLAESLIAIQSKLFSSSGGLDSLSPPTSAGSFQRRESLSKEGEERLTNAQIVIDVLDLLFRMIMDPPKLWSVELINHLFVSFERTKNRMISLTSPTEAPPELLRATFPIIDPTDGFTNAVLGRIQRFEELMGQLTFNVFL